MSFVILLGMSFQFGYNIGVLNQPVEVTLFASHCFTCRLIRSMYVPILSAEVLFCEITLRGIENIVLL